MTDNEKAKLLWKKILSNININLKYASFSVFI